MLIVYSDYSTYLPSIVEQCKIENEASDFKIKSPREELARKLDKEKAYDHVN